MRVFPYLEDCILEIFIEKHAVAHAATRKVPKLPCGRSAEYHRAPVISHWPLVIYCWYWKPLGHVQLHCHLWQLSQHDIDVIRRWQLNCFCIVVFPPKIIDKKLTIPSQHLDSIGCAQSSPDMLSKQPESLSTSFYRSFKIFI